MIEAIPVALEAPRSDLFPLSLLRYVVRTGEEVIEEQVTTSARFSTDPYVAANSVRSAMCLPIKRASVVAGVLYLENNLTAGAFTRERAARCSSCSPAQAALSSSNARLYRSLEEHSRTLQQRSTSAPRAARQNDDRRALAQLRDTQKQLVLQEKLASLGALTAGIAHEMKNPLNFVNNFAELSVELADELAAELAQQRTGSSPRRARGDSTSSPALRQNVGQDPRARPARRRHRPRDAPALPRHARDAGARVDLNALLAEHVSLAYQGARRRAAASTSPVEHETSDDPGLGTVRASPQDLSRVFLNLVDNAYYAAGAPERAAAAGFVPAAPRLHANLGDSVEIRIRDNGGRHPGRAS